MTPEEWTEKVEEWTQFKAALEQDYNADRMRFGKFRSVGGQLSKLQGNLQRLYRRKKLGESGLQSEIESREKQVAKLRKNGVVPSPGICVFNQLDIDKSRTITVDELKRLFKAFEKVYPASDIEIQKVF